MRFSRYMKITTFPNTELFQNQQAVLYRIRTTKFLETEQIKKMFKKLSFLIRCVTQRVCFMSLDFVFSSYVNEWTKHGGKMIKICTPQFLQFPFPTVFLQTISLFLGNLCQTNSMEKMNSVTEFIFWGLSQNLEVEKGCFLVVSFFYKVILAVYMGNVFKVPMHFFLN